MIAKDSSLEGRSLPKSAIAADALLLLSLGLLIIAMTGRFPFSGVYSSPLGVMKIGPKPSIWAGLFALSALARITIRHESGRISGLLTHPNATRLFLIALFIYNANGRQIGAVDTIPSRFLPYSLLREGNFDLDEFRFLYTQGVPAYLIQSGGHVVSAYPPGPAILALPFYLLPILGRVPPQSKLLIDVEKLAAAVLTALSVALIYAAIRRLEGQKAALTLSLIYAFGTSSLSISSQALWQHGPSQLLLAASLYCLARGMEQPKWAACSGFTLAWAVVCRPTNLLIVIPLAAYVFHAHRKLTYLFTLLTLPAAAFMLLYNQRHFGAATRMGYDQGFFSGGAWNTSFFDGLAGILLSPSRGLFIYSPVFALSLGGMYIAWRRSENLLYKYMGVAVVSVIVLYSKWGHWWGGWAFGPRLLADLTPLLTLLIVPVYQHLTASSVLRGTLYALAAVSITIHALGAFGPGVWSPGGNPQSKRLWSWTDGELVYRSRLWVHKLVGTPRPRELPIASLSADRSHYRGGEQVRVTVSIRGGDSEAADLYLAIVGPDGQRRFIGPSELGAAPVPLLSPVPWAALVERSVVLTLSDDLTVGQYVLEWWLYQSPQPGRSAWGGRGLIDTSSGPRLTLAK
jgi:hypothetical protein